MGLIREPKGVDLIVGPSILTDKDRKMTIEIIATYKKTGKLPSKAKKQTHRERRSTVHNKSIIQVEFDIRAIGYSCYQQ